MRLAPWAVLVGLTALGIPCFAQERECEFGDALPPASASTLEGLVPNGSQIEARVEGDLDGDASPDVALILVLAAPDPELDPQVPARDVDGATRALLVARATATGYTRVGLGRCVLPCRGCGGLVGDGSPPELSVRRRVLSASWMSGASTRHWHTIRLRLDTATQQMVLIGEESGVWSYPWVVERVSTNYLTREQWREETVDRSGRPHTTNRRTRLPPQSPRVLEALRHNLPL